MPKTVIFTTITPLPAGITRQSVLDMYRDHLAMIDLNPLVVERYKCKPPTYAPTSEYYATWYTIKDKVSYLPGGLATGSVSYHAVFHDFPDCLETHVYAPLGLDIRGKWSVGGSLPGEPKERVDYKLKTPRSGLYIREEVKMTCSKLLMGFVKKTFKDSHSRLVEKLVERAHILESNFANERLQALRNVEPRERMGHGDIFIAPPPDYQFAPPPYRPLASPRLSPHSRSQSANPILTPRMSPSYPIHERSASVSSLPTQQERPSSSSALSPKAASAPDQSLFLLPATTYDGGLSSSFNRPISLYPGTAAHPPSTRVVSTYYEDMVTDDSSDDESDEEIEPAELEPFASHVVSPPFIPEVRPMTFNFMFDPRTPGPKTPISNEDLLANIDAAIDESYLYYSADTHYDALPTPNALQATISFETLPATTYELLPATTYNASPTSFVDTLPATTYKASPTPSIDTLPATTYKASPIPSVDTLPATTYSASPTSSVDTLPATTYTSPSQTLDTLPATTYSPGTFLPSTTYVPSKQHQRKDSVMPYNSYPEECPPVPPKDEKYRKPSIVAF